MSPWTKVALTPAPRAAFRASARRGAERSSPVTRYPRFARPIECRPAPHPRSRMRPPFRMDVSDQVIGPEEVLVPSLRDLRHRPPRTACAGKILPRSLLRDPRPGFPLDREAEMLQVRDHGVFAARLEELDDRLDLRPHAARRELPLREVLP